MKILIYGASGGTGHELAGQALNKGHHVTAFVRNPSKLKIAHPNLNVVIGELNNYRLIENVIRGQDAVLSTLGASSPFKYDQAVVDGVNNIINAMKATGVSRFIYMSFVGVKETRSHAGLVIKYIAPKILSTEIAGHEAREYMIRQSGLRWTIVRAPTLTNGKFAGQYKTGEEIKSKGFVVSISRADVADFMLQQLEDNTFIRKSPLILR